MQVKTHANKNPIAANQTKITKRREEIEQVNNN